MKWSELLDNWSLTSLKLTTGFLNMQWQPNEQDKQCAWELYVDLITRITTQPLDDTHGDEQSALNSVHSLFATTRHILKTHGRHCHEFTRLSVVVLNQIIRPFTAKWHKYALAEQLNPQTHPQVCQTFRDELAQLQVELTNYTKLLADMAGVEDLTAI